MHNESSDYGSGPQTLTAMLQQRALQFPDRNAFVFETDAQQAGTDAQPTGTDAQQAWTYGELDHRARAIAAWLATQTNSGDRVLLVYPPGLDFIAGFFGCVYAGVLPVPATYPKPRRPLPRLERIVSDCQPCMVLTTSQTLDTLSLDKQSAAVSSLRWEATDLLEAQASTDFQPVGRQPEDLAFLQYTSGSTSDPRGVMVSHANLMHNLEAIRIGFGLPSAGAVDQVTSGVFWLPAYHDMGLIGGILTPLHVGGTSHLMPPAAFLRQPLSWLETISRTGAAISGAPNFGYELCLRKTTPEQRAELDLSAWRLAFCGAEPINPLTLQEFSAAFEPAGFRHQAFYPCYGLAEATLLVTGGQGPQVLHVDRKKLRDKKVEQVEPTHSDSQSLVSCGKVLGDQQLAVIDPQSQTRCREAALGEIWVRGHSLARGYWNRGEVDRELFQAPILDEGDQTYLRTGDVGFLWSDQLYVTGRLKDVIIVRGRNHFPNDIELTGQAAHEAVDMGAAFALTGDREERLVVVHQVQREHRRADLDAVLMAIRKSIVEEHEIDPHAILLIKPASLPLTSSGKVQRGQCREQYLAKQLSVSAEWTNMSPNENAGLNGEASAEGAQAEPMPTRPNFRDGSHASDPVLLADKIQAWLLGWLSARVELPLSSLESSTPFAELGVDSLTAVELSHELDQVFGLKLPPVVAWDYPTPESLSRYLAEQLIKVGSVQEGSERTAVVERTEGDS